MACVSKLVWEAQSPKDCTLELEFDCVDMGHNLTPLKGLYERLYRGALLGLLRGIFGV